MYCINMPWVEIIGSVGAVLLLVMYQMNTKRSMLNVQSASHLAFALHFALLGATTGAMASIFRVLRNYAFLKWPKNIFTFITMQTLLIVLGLITWHDWTSVLPIAATVIGSTALWQDNPRNIRLLSLFVPPFWFAYSLFNGSVSGMVGYSALFISMALGVWRFDVAKSKRAKRSRPRVEHDAVRGAT